VKGLFHIFCEGIIYCLTQKDTEEVTLGLQTRGFGAGCYHANLDAKHRSKVHALWTKNEIQVTVILRGIQSMQRSFFVSSYGLKMLHIWSHAWYSIKESVWESLLDMIICICTIIKMVLFGISKVTTATTTMTTVQSKKCVVDI